jgi:uncharacterized protein YndB with AHSA1/START domain
MLLPIAGVIVVAIGIVLIYVITRPDTIAIRRATIIAAPPAIVFALISDLRRWPEWAPQDREDPSMARTYGPVTSGIGATSAWTSKGSAGRGHMVVRQATPDSNVVIDVDFQAPFVAHNVNTFALEPSDGGTRVIWSMEGTNVTLMKVMSIFVSPEQMLGPHFKTGLANLKAMAETQVRSGPALDNAQP